MPHVGPRSKQWCFTINNFSFKDICIVSAFDSDYLVVGEEVGDSGTPHLQGYVVFKKKTVFSTVKKLHASAHWEAAAGSPQQNRTYCTKDGNFWETGVIPAPGKRTDLDSVREMVRAKRPMREIADVVTNYQQLRFAQSYYALQPLPTRDDITVHWFYGPSGTGKSTRAHAVVEHSHLYHKIDGKWFDGYTGESHVLWDDFRDSEVPATFLYRLLQPFPLRGEVKGTSTAIAARTFLFTSIKPPWVYYPHEDPTQLLRRITTIVFTGPRSDFLAEKLSFEPYRKDCPDGQRPLIVRD